MNTFRKLTLTLGVLIALFAMTASVQAASKVSKSKMGWRTFWNCARGVKGICLPLLYNYDGMVVVNYKSKYDSRRRANIVTITGVDQSVSMYGAANNRNPCGVRLGIAVKVYDNTGRLVATLHGTRNGSYIVGRGTLIYGRVSSPNLVVADPTFKVTATSASAQCFNLPSSLSWSFRVP